MKCLETRNRDGIRYRRYLAEDGRVIRTYEVPATVLKGIGMKRVRAELEKWQRGEAGRARQIRMRELIAQGVKPLFMPSVDEILKVRLGAIVSGVCNGTA